MQLKQRLGLKAVRTKFKVLSTLSKTKAAAAAFELFCTPQIRVVKEPTGIFLKAERLHFKFLGKSIQGFCWPGGAKKVLLLHGFESTIINFEGFVQPLLNAGFTVMGFDAPAHGHSTGTQTNVLEYIRFIEHIQKTYGPVDSFIAHSLGGLSVSLYLDGLADVHQKKLVLIAPATETSTAINHYFHFLRLSDAVRPSFEQIIVERSGHPISWFSITRVLRSKKINTLWCHDKGDEMTPLRDVQPLMAENPPHVQFYITEGLGHRRIYRSTDVVRRAVQFLGSAHAGF